MFYPLHYEVYLFTLPKDEVALKNSEIVGKGFIIYAWS